MKVGALQWVSVICAIQHTLTESKVPIVFCAVLLEVFPGHALCGALLELHLPITTFFSCALKSKEDILNSN